MSTGLTVSPSCLFISLGVGKIAEVGRPKIVSVSAKSPCMPGGDESVSSNSLSIEELGEKSFEVRAFLLLVPLTPSPAAFQMYLIVVHSGTDTGVREQGRCHGF